jgi:putative transposase
MSPRQSTFALTLGTFLQQSHFQKAAHAELFIQTLTRYRSQRKFLLHGFAIMPNHIHLLLTPLANTDLPKAIQLIKGGYSFAARSITPKEIWQHGHHEHRVRDLSDFDDQLRYIANNPPAARFPKESRFVHTHPEMGAIVDPWPESVLG